MKGHITYKFLFFLNIFSLKHMLLIIAAMRKRCAREYIESTKIKNPMN